MKKRPESEVVQKYRTDCQNSSKEQLIPIKQFITHHSTSLNDSEQ